MKRKSDTCVSDEFEIDSLIENIQLMNCFNGYDEFKLLKESTEIKNRLNELQFKEINEIIKKTYMRYKRYLINVDMEGLQDIDNGIRKFLNIYRNETDLSNWFIKYKQLLNIMIETDQLILNEIDNYPTTTKRYKS